MTDKWVAARAAHSHSDRHELVTRWLTRWSTLLFPAWVLVVNLCILIDNLRRVANRRDPRAAKCPHERRSGARGRCLFAHLGNPRGVRGRGWLIPAESLGRFDVEVEIVDGPQRLGGGAFLKAVGQGLEPRPVLGVEGEQDSDGIMPSPGSASVVNGSPVVDHRQGCGTGGAVPGLSLDIGHRFVADGPAGHGSTPKRYVAEPPWDQARCLKRQLSLSVSMISQWWVRRSSSAVVILASPNTLGHSPKARLVVTTMEVRS